MQAMGDAGFLARLSGGSAVIFELEDDRRAGPTGRIVFYKPHPVAKIDPVMFRCMGRRMKKSFGWANDVFCLE